MDIKVRAASLADMEMLIKWRMEVLHEVFGVPLDEPMEELEQENRLYYQKELPLGRHIACFACMDYTGAGVEVVGCGGLCIYQEIPSPDNPSGWCAYLMNIYTRPRFRGMGVGEKVVRWLAAQAQEREITKIYLETSAAGKALYQKLGFSEMEDYMKLDSAEQGRG